MARKNPDIRPLIQAIMVGHLGKNSFSFSRDRYSIKKKKQHLKPWTIDFGRNYSYIYDSVALVV